MNPVFEAVHADVDSSFRCTHVSCKRFSDNHTWHYHAEYELAHVISSRGTRFVGDSTQRYEPGDLVLLGPNLPHCWNDDPRAAGEPAPEMRTIQFSAQLLGEDLLALSEMKRIRRLLAASAAGIHFQAAMARRAGELMRQTLEASGLARLIKLLELLSGLAEADSFKLLARHDHSVNATANRERLDYVHRYIRKHLGSQISQAHLAATLGLSASAFSRFFKTATGKTFVAFVNLERINEVCRHLSNSERAITQIAMACGYNNVSNFNCQFFACKGMSPTEYRQRCRRKAQHHRHHVELGLAG